MPVEPRLLTEAEAAHFRALAQRALEDDLADDAGLTDDEWRALMRLEAQGAGKVAS